MKNPTYVLFPALLVAMLPVTAHAQEPSQSTIAVQGPSQSTLAQPSTWYGWETLAVDGAALALFVPSITTSPPVATPFGIGSAVSYGLGAPIAHFARGYVGTGFIDLGLRVGLPIVGFFLGGLLGGAIHPSVTCSAWLGCLPNADDGAWMGSAIGTLSGAGLASALDALLLAREPAVQAVPPRDRASPAPHLGVGADAQGGARATFGMSGAF